MALAAMRVLGSGRGLAPGRFIEHAQTFASLAVGLRSWKKKKTTKKKKEKTKKKRKRKGGKKIRFETSVCPVCGVSWLNSSLGNPPLCPDVNLSAEV